MSESSFRSSEYDAPNHEDDENSNYQEITPRSTARRTMRNRIPRQQTAGMLSDSDFSEEGELSLCLNDVTLHSTYFSAGISLLESVTTQSLAATLGTHLKGHRNKKLTENLHTAVPAISLRADQHSALQTRAHARL